MCSIVVRTIVVFHLSVITIFTFIYGDVWYAETPFKIVVSVQLMSLSGKPFGYDFQLCCEVEVHSYI